MLSEMKKQAKQETASVATGKSSEQESPPETSSSSQSRFNKFSFAARHFSEYEVALCWLPE